MATAGVRTWDLCESAGEGLPTPCRVLRCPPAHRTAIATALERRHPPLCLLERPDHLLLAGPARALLDFTRLLPPPAGPVLAAALEAYEAAPRPLRFADGASLDMAGAARVMGIINVTPDSFSDGGLFVDPGRATEQAARMAEEGADLVDVGGESSRPGATPVDTDEELARVIPVVRRIRRELPTLRISVDTRRGAVARQALEAGADMINDISALADPSLARVVAEWGCPVVLMHMRGEPRSMQADTRYDDLLQEIFDHLAERSARARESGIEDDRILVDPGVGFGKSVEGNEEILRRLGSFRSLGFPILVGVSRKMFVGFRSGVEVPAARLAGSLAAACAAVLAGARIIRAHDVAATRQALAVVEPLQGWPRRGPAEGSR
ncbi:MAG: dihydropteroate synthase [Acidobacteriota bacterium]|nr:dihydropteroate synthase [Acidobacteriota bacterium]MDQ7087684.1 dihydropteroate synthase [Acidobacteriota bacterium]